MYNENDKFFNGLYDYKLDSKLCEIWKINNNSNKYIYICDF